MTIPASTLQSERKTSALNQTGKRKARILVVDDDPGLLRLLTIRLRAESYDVEAVESGVQALAAASRFRPDLVITDLRMDHMDGIGSRIDVYTVYPKTLKPIGKVKAMRRQSRSSTGWGAGSGQASDRSCSRSGWDRGSGVSRKNTTSSPPAIFWSGATERRSEAS